MSKNIFYHNQEISLQYDNVNHLIPNALWHCGLSLQALGVASYIYTLPKQWRLSVSHLSKQLMISPNSCRKYLKEIFSNEKARSVFQVVEVCAESYDLECGFYAYDDSAQEEQVQIFTSMVAKDTSKPKKKQLLIVQTREQRYLLNLCFSLRQRGRNNVQNAREIHAQNLRTIKRDNKLSLKDSSSKHASAKDKFTEQSAKKAQNLPRQKAKQNLVDFLNLESYTQKEQEAITLWIRYKQELARKPLKPSQLDFQLRKIAALKAQGQDIAAVIGKSLDMGWQGLFAFREVPKALESSVALKPKPTKNLGAKALLQVVEHA